MRWALVLVSCSLVCGAACDGVAPDETAPATGVIPVRGADSDSGKPWSRAVGAEFVLSPHPASGVRDCDANPLHCVPASCFNGVRDPGEVGIDCGGPCLSCGGHSCSEDSDCASGSCWRVCH